MYKTIKLTNPKYRIVGEFIVEKKYYDMFYAMYRVRPEEALQDILLTCYGTNVQITNEMVEKVIEDEYDIVSSLDDIIGEARKIHANM